MITFVYDRNTAGSEGPVTEKQIANPEMIILATKNFYRAEIEMVKDEVEKSTARKNYYNNITKTKLRLGGTL